VLFLTLRYALELLEAARTLREKLIVRYMLFNGLSPMEISCARIEHLDPVECSLFLPRRHWKRNCVCDVDPETVRLQILYSGSLEEGPLIRRRDGAHITTLWIWHLVKRVARRTNIPGKKAISPLILKRTFAREWLLATKNLGSLQKQLSHRHLASTAHYLRFVMEDVKPNHARMMRRWENERRKRGLRPQVRRPRRRVR